MLEIIKNASCCITVGNVAGAVSYKKRNYYMVDNADFLLAVYDNDKKVRSGTGQTVNYALQKNAQFFIFTQILQELHAKHTKYFCDIRYIDFIFA